MPCVCRKKITPSQHNPANLKSNTPRSSLTNEGKEAAPRDLLLTGVSVASVGSQPRAQPFSQRAEEEKQVFLLPSEGSGALGSPQALGAAVVLSRSATHLLCALHVLPQPSRVLQLLEELEWVQDTSALGLSTRMCTRNFPRAFIIPGTVVNSWLGN